MIKILNTSLYNWLIDHQDNSFVQNCLGEIHFRKKDYVDAVKWFSKSIEQNNKWSYYDLGWLAIRGLAKDITYTQGKELYYKSITHEFTEAIDNSIINGFWMNIKEQRILYNQCVKYSSSDLLRELCNKFSVLSKDEFNTMNRVLKISYTYPQTVSEWYKMDRKYKGYIEYKKKSFVSIYDTAVIMPKVLVQLVVDYV
jgi:tetratricopeptide (TPR) repeat protein